MTQKQALWLVTGFASVWIALIGIDYLSRNDYYLASFADGKALVTFLLLVAFLGVVLFVVQAKRAKKGRPRLDLKSIEVGKVRGLTLYLITLVAAAIPFGVWGFQEEAFTDGMLPAMAHFLGFNILVHAAVLLVVAAAFSTGNYLLLLGKLGLSRFTHALVAIALGFSVLCLLLFVLGALGWLRQPVVATCLAVMVISGGRHTLRFLRSVLYERLPSTRLPLYAIGAGFVLLLTIGMNLGANLSPLPLGFDAIGLYLNTANLVSDYGALIRGGQAYNWSLMASMGFVVFKSTAVALMLMILPGVLATLVVYHIASRYLTPAMSIVTAALSYTIPVVIWQSTNDTKVDLALLFVGLCALLLIVEKHEARTHEKFSLRSSIVWIAAGWLMGFGFGIKYTAVLSILAILTLLAWRSLGKWGYWALCLLSSGLLLVPQEKQFASPLADGNANWVIALLCGMGLIAVGIGARRKLASLWTPVRNGLVLTGAAVVAFSPWAIKHLTENQELSLHAILNGKSSVQTERRSKSAESKPASVYVMPVMMFPAAGPPGIDAEPGLSEPDERVGNGIREELTRYVGYESGVMRFVTLPYDVTMRANVEGNLGVDPSLIPLALLPVIVLSFKRREWWRTLSMIVLTALVWMVSVAGLGSESVFGGIGNWPGVTWLSEVLQTPSDPWSFLIVLALALGASAVIATGRTEWSFELKSLMAFVASGFLLWLLFGSGVPWYGLTTLVLLPVVIMVLPRSLAESGGRARLTYIVGFTVALWLTMVAALRLTDFEPLNPDLSGPYHSALLPYMAGVESADEALDRLNPAMRTALTRINQDIDSKVLRIGTHMQYFIRQNDRRVIEDNQLEFFERAWRRAKNQRAVNRRLQQSGIRFIVVDLNTAALDQTPEKSLQTKFQHLMAYFTNNPALQLLSTDRLVVDYNSRRTITIEGQTVPVASGINGQVVYGGHIAVFEIVDG
jgi:hypothetical protein